MFIRERREESRRSFFARLELLIRAGRVARIGPVVRAGRAEPVVRTVADVPHVSDDVANPAVPMSRLLQFRPKIGRRPVAGSRLHGPVTALNRSRDLTISRSARQRRRRLYAVSYGS